MLAITALSGLAAGTAQATTTGHWTVGGIEVNSVFPVEMKGGSTTFNVPGLLQYSCSAYSSSEASILPGGKSEVGALTFTGCTLSSAPNCVMHTVGYPVGTLSYGPFLGELVLANGHFVDIISAKYPKAEYPLGQFKIEATTGKTCSLSGTGKQYGSLAFEPSTVSAVDLAVTTNEKLTKELEPGWVHFVGGLFSSTTYVGTYNSSMHITGKSAGQLLGASL